MSDEYEGNKRREMRWEQMRGTPPPKSTDEVWKERHLLQEQYIKQLETEKEAANEMFRKLNIHSLNLIDRIKRLEEDLMDAKNQYAVLLADVALYEDRGERIKRLEEENDAMRADLLLWNEKEVK